MLSTWSDVNCCLFLLMISPALQKARSDVALDACAHSRCLAKSAILGWAGPYLSHHFNIGQLLKLMTKPLLGVLTCALFNHLCAVALHSFVNEYPCHDFLGFAVAPPHKLDFHHSPLGCSALVWSLVGPSYLDDDALHPRVFLCSNCTRPQKQIWRLGPTFQRDEYGKRQIDSHLVCNALFHPRH